MAANGSEGWLVAWRAVSLVIFGMTFIVLLLSFSMAESPRFLIATGQQAKAEELLRYIARVNWKSLECPEELDGSIELEDAADLDISDQDAIPLEPMGESTESTVEM